MSYQVLARKWRPRSFDTLVGQNHVVRALTHALKNGRLHHAYLFTGTRGVGKTTIARILAKALNCETGLTANPCGICSACQEIDAGRFVDLLEVDAATNTRVDEMRQLLENAMYAPTRGRYKVYVIDEVHMLSNAAFNSMLKTLEEPPEHVKFILATTDPQKIPVTVLSRCLQFNLKQMSHGAIVSHLAFVLDEEKVSYEEAGLRLLARAANGSMRDALSLLDQAIAYDAGEVKADGVSGMLGTLGSEHLFQIINALIDSDPLQLAKISDEIGECSISYDATLAALAELWVRVQTAQFVGVGAPSGDGEEARYIELAAKLGSEYVQLAYSIVLQGRSQLSLAPDPAAGFLMTLLRLYAFRPNNESVEKKNTAPDEFIAPTALSPIPKSLPAPSAGQGAAVFERQPVAPAPQAVPQLSWSAMLAELQLAGLARELGAHCDLVAYTPDCLRLSVSQTHRHLLSKASQEKLLAAIVDRYGVREVSISFGELINETPAQIETRNRNAAQEMAIAAIESDRVVQDIVELFDASVIDTSIRSLAG